MTKRGQKISLTRREKKHRQREKIALTNREKKNLLTKRE